MELIFTHRQKQDGAMMLTSPVQITPFQGGWRCGIFHENDLMQVADFSLRVRTLLKVGDSETNAPKTQCG